MRLSQITLSGVVLLAASASAQQVDFDVRPGAPRTGASPAPAVSQLPPAPVVGSDACATAEVIPSAEPVTVGYDQLTTPATVEPTIGQTTFTGGYCNYGCAEYGSGQVAVLTDVWFSYIVPVTGRLRITTCPNQNDTKIAIYSGLTCPTGTACLQCNDDYHFSGGTTAGLLDSILYQDVTMFDVLLIQVGQSSFNVGAPGLVGTFDIEIDPAHETGAAPFDDNAAETNLNVGAVLDGALGINRYGNVGDVTTVTGAEVCWGWAGSMGWTAGHPAYIHLWDDSLTNDGDPTDAVWLDSVASPTITSPGTDTYVPFTFPLGPHVISGIYFIGYGSQKTAAVAGFNNFPITADNSTCNIQPNTTWWVNNVAAPANIVLASNTTPPHRLEDPVGGFLCQAQGAFSGILHSAMAIRAVTQAGPPPLGTGACFGTVATCPCTAAGGSAVANPGAAGHGCANTGIWGSGDGALLTASGFALEGFPTYSTDTVVLRCENMTGPGLFLQSNALIGPIINFNDGGLCAAGGVIVRLGLAFPGGVNPPGVGVFPNPADSDPISKQSFDNVPSQPVLLGGVPTPETKHYQCWYRDIPTFCNPATHNMSNSVSFAWAP